MYYVFSNVTRRHILLGLASPDKVRKITVYYIGSQVDGTVNGNGTTSITFYLVLTYTLFDNSSRF